MLQFQRAGTQGTARAAGFPYWTGLNGNGQGLERNGFSPSEVGVGTPTVTPTALGERDVVAASSVRSTCSPGTHRRVPYHEDVSCFAPAKH